MKKKPAFLSIHLVLVAVLILLIVAIAVGSLTVEQ